MMSLGLSWLGLENSGDPVLHSGGGNLQGGREVPMKDIIEVDCGKCTQCFGSLTLTLAMKSCHLGLYLILSSLCKYIELIAE